MQIYDERSKMRKEKYKMFSMGRMGAAESVMESSVLKEIKTLKKTLKLNGIKG